MHPSSGSQILALANAAELEIADVLALDNTLTLDNEGWALLAPFGEHPKERLAEINGQTVHEKYVQIFDDESIDTVLANEKGDGIFARLKRAFIKRPIYRDHPDLKQFAPETITSGNDRLVPIGVNDDCRKTARGLEFKPQLVPAGAHAVEREGCKYPSGLFLFQKTGRVRAGGIIEVRPFKLASIGLTPFPNMSGVDSLANARQQPPAEQNTKTEPPMKLIAGWLLAQGVALANTETPTETQVLEGIQKLHTSRAADVTALANEKSNLSGTITSLENEKTALATERDGVQTKLTDTQLALANEQTALKTERKARVEAVVDLIITQGRLEVAGRDAKVGELIALANDKIDGAIADLGKLPVKFSVVSAAGGERKADATQIKSAHEQVLALANSDPRYKDIKDFGTAMTAVLKDHPLLAEQLRARPVAEKKDPATT